MQLFTPFQYILIDVANNYGLDKLSWDDRIDWTKDNINCLDLLVDSADSPLLFQKAAHALKKIRQGYASEHTMSLDATSSGAQIMSCLAGCHTSAENTNVVDIGERVNLYEVVTNHMQKKLLKKGITTDVVAKDAKKAIMTTLYNSRAKPRELFGEDTVELAMFYKAMNKKIPGPMDVMQHINEGWDPTTLNHKWTLPNGFEVIIPVMEEVEHNYEIDELDKYRFTEYRQMNMVSDYGVALPAHIVQSLDGWLVDFVIRVLDNRRTRLSVFTIHDSFWGHLHDMNHIRETYNKGLSLIVENNLLELIMAEITGGPTHWVTEDLNPKDVLEANYALS